MNAHQFDINRKKYKIKQVIGKGKIDNADREKEEEEESSIDDYSNSADGNHTPAKNKNQEEMQKNDKKDKVKDKNQTRWNRRSEKWRIVKKKIKSLDRATRKWYKTLKIILDRVKQFNMQRNEDEKNRKKTRYKEKHKKNQKHEMKRRKT